MSTWLALEPGAWQLILLTLEATLVASLLLLLFNLRTRLGLSPLFVAIGTFQYLQVVLALSVYVEVMPGILISPGSAVLFTSTLFAVLLVYIQDDAAHTRELIFGLVAANLTVSLLSPLFGLHLDSPVARNLLELPRELFSLNAKVLLLGTATLIMDVFLVIILYELMSRLVRGHFLRVFVAMALTLMVDSTIFVGGTFFGQPQYGSILLSSILGKVVAALFFAVTMAVYLRFFGDDRRARVGEPSNRSIFAILSFRQRYEGMREQVARDALTGLFNRGFFDEVLPLELAGADRQALPTSLLLIDLDHFKSVNDRFGHPEGDRILREFAGALQDSLRTADVACRIGGEEFAVILPEAAGPAARQLAERIRERMSERLAETDSPLAKDGVTATAGIATFPVEGETAEELIRVADERLYEGKRAGRDRVIGGR